MGTEQSHDELREFSDYIDNLVEHSDGIYELREEIYEVFDMEFSENNRETDFEGFFSRIDMVFAAKIDEDNRGHTSEALINAVSQIERQDERELREQREEYELAEVLRTLKRRYGEEVTRRIKRKYQGNRWWSNIKTDPKFRGGKPAFTHEITIDTNEIIEIDNDVSNAITLANHFVTQVKMPKRRMVMMHITTFEQTRWNR
jgi:hypothetical protein